MRGGAVHRRTLDRLNAINDSSMKKGGGPCQIKPQNWTWHCQITIRTYIEGQDVGGRGLGGRITRWASAQGYSLSKLRITRMPPLRGIWWATWEPGWIQGEGELICRRNCLNASNESLLHPQKGCQLENQLASEGGGATVERVSESNPPLAKPQSGSNNGQVWIPVVARTCKLSETEIMIIRWGRNFLKRYHTPS